MFQAGSKEVSGVCKEHLKDVSVSFFARPRQERNSNEKIDELFSLISLKTTHPGHDQTKTRLSKIETDETRPRQDCLKICIRNETSLGTFSLETETRPRLSSFTRSKGVPREFQ